MALFGFGRDGPLEGRIDALTRMIADAKRIVAFTGAGISTDSGLPDYRGPDGVWTRRDKGLPPPRAFIRIEDVEPNPSHYALYRLMEEGRLVFLISQNVDNLHLKSGIDPAKIAELHGNGALMKCLACDRRFSKSGLHWDEGRWGKGYRTDRPISGQPLCSCGGRIISSVVNFGDPMPEHEMKLAGLHAKNCDVFLAIGSSLAVSPANSFPAIAKRHGAKLVIMNQGDTPLDRLADLRFHEGVGDTLPAVVSSFLGNEGA